MNSGTSFPPQFYGWCLGLGFILIAALLYIAWNDGFFSFIIRALETRQKHRHELEKIRMRAELARKGTDPSYIRFLEDELHKDQ